MRGLQSSFIKASGLVPEVNCYRLQSSIEMFTACIRVLLDEHWKYCWWQKDRHLVSWKPGKSTGKELWCHCLPRHPCRQGSTIYVKPKSSGRSEGYQGTLKNYYGIMNCGFYMGLLFIIWSLMLLVSCQKDLEQRQFYCK